MNLKSAGLALVGVSALAIAHPLLVTLGQGATFFVAHGADTLDILCFVLVVYLLPSTLIIAIASCLQFINTKLASVFLSLAVGLLTGLWSMSMTSAWPATYSIALALVIVVLTAWCYLTRSGLRDFLQIIGICSPIVVVYFLLFTPAKSLLVPDSDFEGNLLAERKTPIVLLLFDELSLAAITTPDGEIDAGRLPNFSRLEQFSTWYHDTTTASVQTDKAVPAILSGMRPNENSQPVYSEFPRNLFSLLAASHTISATEMFTRLCPEYICSSNGDGKGAEYNAVPMYRDVWIIWLHSILPVDLASQYLPSIASSWHNFRGVGDSASGKSSSRSLLARIFDKGKNQKRRFGHFTAGIRNDTGPSVNYLHLALPHIPWIYLPDGTIYNGQFIPGRSTPGYGWKNNQFLVDSGVLRYSLQVEYVDMLLGQALDALKQSGRLNETMLIIVSDHGVAFTPGEQRRIPVPSTLAAVSRVPLFIKYPGQVTGVRDNRKIETIDILPTVADVLGLPLSGDMDGQSIISHDWVPAARHVLEGAESISNFESEMDFEAASERVYRVLKPGKSALEAIGLGTGRQYIGNPAPAPTGLEKEFVLQLDNSTWYTEVNPDSGFLPARLTGTLYGAGQGTEILIALNDVFAGSGMTYDETGHVSIMLDPRLFHPGSNSLRAYRIDDQEIFEITVDLDFEGWSIHRGDEGAVTVTDDQGTSYQLDESLKGHAAFSWAGLKSTTLRGYACDERLLLAPKVLLLVEDDAVITTGFHITPRNTYSQNEPVPNDLECWFLLEMYENTRRRSASVSVMALFEDGRMVEIQPKL